MLEKASEPGCCSMRKHMPPKHSFLPVNEDSYRRNLNYSKFP